MLRRGKTRGFCSDRAEVEEQLIKLDEESEETISKARKVRPIHFIDMDLFFGAGFIPPPAFLANGLVGGGGVPLLVVLQLPTQELVLAFFRIASVERRHGWLEAHAAERDAQVMGLETGVAGSLRFRIEMQ